MHDVTRGAIWRRITGLLLLTAALAATPAARTQSTPDEVVEIDGKHWSLATSDGAVAWEDAEAFCDTLEAGGFSDWRLPRLMELESLHDPAAPGSIRGPFEMPDCCAWAAENLVELATDRKGNLPDPGGPPAGYYWGFLFADGISYYSNGRFTDGFALCTRGPAGG